MQTITADGLAKTAERRYLIVQIGAGLSARIQSIDEVERSAYEAIAYDDKGAFQIARLKLRRRKLLQLCLVDDEGNRLFQPSDLPKMKMDAGVAGKIFHAAQEHCGLDDERLDIEDAKKNSELMDDSEESSESVSEPESSTSSSGSGELTQIS